jgi:hypothetical protein
VLSLWNTLNLWARSAARPLCKASPYAVSTFSVGSPAELKRNQRINTILSSRYRSEQAMYLSLQRDSQVGQVVIAESLANMRIG